MLSAAVAQAKPAFVVTETLARAGDTVHFSITGADGRVTYELEIDDRDVAVGSAPAGGPFAGSFTMPNLGDARRTVKVEAELRDSHKHQKVKHKLEYLGRVLPVTERPAETEAPPLPAPHNPPVVVPDAAPVAAPVHLPQTAGPPARTPAVNPRSTNSTRQSRKHRTAKRRRGAPQRSAHKRSQRHRRAHDKRDRGHEKRRARRLPPPRTAPLFDGVPERGAGGGVAPRTGGASGLHAIAPRTAVLAAAAESGNDFGINGAVMIPAFLALLGAGLVGIAARRSRSRRG